MHGGTKFYRLVTSWCVREDDRQCRCQARCPRYMRYNVRCHIVVSHTVQRSRQRILDELTYNGDERSVISYLWG